MAHRHGNQGATVQPVDAQHVVAAEVRARGECLHCKALLLQDGRPQIEDEAFVPSLALFHDLLVREEGMPFTVEREQHAQLPVERLQQGQLQQPPGDADVQIPHDDGSEELPLRLVAVQDGHRLVLSDLPQDAERRGSNRRRARGSDPQHGQLPANRARREMAHPAHALGRSGRPPGRLLILLGGVTDKHICRACHQDEHGVLYRTLVHDGISRHEDAVDRRGRQLLHKLQRHAGEDPGARNDLHKAHGVGPRFLVLVQHEDLLPLVVVELQGAHHHILMQHLHAAVPGRVERHRAGGPGPQTQRRHAPEDAPHTQKGQLLVLDPGDPHQAAHHHLERPGPGLPVQIANQLALGVKTRFQVACKEVQELGAAVRSDEVRKDAGLLVVDAPDLLLEHLHQQAAVHFSVAVLGDM